MPFKISSTTIDRVIIKPIKSVAPVQQAEIPQSKIDSKQSQVQVRLTPPSGKWVLQQGRIILNGQDVGQLIAQSGVKNTSLLSKLASDLAAYRNYAITRRLRKKRKKLSSGDVIDDFEVDDPTGELAHLSALVEAYINKIMSAIKKRYDETAHGMSYIIDADGQLILNGMNVTSFIQMARDYPSKKAQIFLRGLKERLSVILSNKSRSSGYERIREITLNLFQEIDQELKKIIEKDRTIENT